MKILVQQEDFSVEQEVNLLRQKSSNTGAVVTFTGLVRDIHGSSKVDSLYLEHYPGMTEKSLAAIVKQAQERWPLLETTVIHRVGSLKATEQIVFVGVSSEHRRAAFEACEFIMDYLKTRAPFWKKTFDEKGDHWVEAKESDFESSDRWQK